MLIFEYNIHSVQLCIISVIQSVAELWILNILNEVLCLIFVDSVVCMYSQEEGAYGVYCYYRTDFLCSVSPSFCQEMPSLFMVPCVDYCVHKNCLQSPVSILHPHTHISLKPILLFLGDLCVFSQVVPSGSVLKHFWHNAQKK